MVGEFASAANVKHTYALESQSGWSACVSMFWGWFAERGCEMCVWGRGVWLDERSIERMSTVHGNRACLCDTYSTLDNCRRERVCVFVTLA